MLKFFVTAAILWNVSSSCNVTANRPKQ